MWSYFFNLGEKGDNDIYEKTSKMSEKWEKIYSDLDNGNDESYNISNNVKKRSEKTQRGYNENREQYGNKESIPPPIKKNNQQNNDNKPMTLEEKNMLGNLIRNLNKEQLRGIIKILADNNDVMKSKYFAFDIDKLSIKKLRELERYVKDCLSSNNSNNESSYPKNVNNNNNNNNSLNKKDNHKNNNNNNDTNKSNTNDIHNQNKNNEQKNNNKEINENNEKNEKKQESTHKLKQQSTNKKNNNNESESLSDSDSISSDSSLSN